MSEKTEDQMEDKRLRLFNLQYTWYEGEHDSTVLATTKEQNEIEKDLKEAASSIKIEENLRDCLPEAYRRIISILRQKGYIECSFFLDPDYYVEEMGIIRKTKFGKYGIKHLIEKSERKRLR